MRWLCLVVAVAACAPRYRNETLGTATAGSSGVALSSAGQHRIVWKVSTPRAMQIAWTLACGGAEASGTTGESFDQYKERRLAELRKKKADEKSAIAALTGAVGATANVETPTGDAQAQVGVDGKAVADAVVSDDVALPPGDLGAGVYQGTTTIEATGAGPCTMQFAPADASIDAAGLYGQFEVTRVHDLVAERNAVRAQTRQGAVAVRVDLGARLVAEGADPELRARQAAAAQAQLALEAQARADAQAKLDAQAQAQAAVDAQAQLQIDARVQAQADAQARAQAELQARIRGGAAGARSAELGFLIGAGADRDHQAKVAAELEARGRRSIELRGQLSAWLIAQGADPDYREKQAIASAQVRAQADARAQAEYDARVRADQAREAALQARLQIDISYRAQLIGYLLAIGAVEKPPMPDPLPEDPGDQPADGAVWVAGEWLWEDAQWQWQAGGWTFPDSGFGDAESSGGGEVVVTVDTGRPIVEDHRDTSVTTTTTQRETTRDHRDESTSSTSERPKERDHRDDKKDDDDERPKSRDHRH